MRFLTSVILLLVCAFATAQEPVLQLDVKTRDDDTGKKLSGVTVEVYQDGKLYATKTSDSRGSVPLIDLPLNHNYTVYIKKEGYVTKVATIDASHPNPEDLPPFVPFDMQTSLFQKVEGVDFSFLESTPMIKFQIDEMGYQIWDQAYTKDMLKKIDELKEQIEEKKKEEEKKKADFDAYVKAGDDAMGKENFDVAISQYELALGLYEDEGVRAKLDDAKKKKKEKEDAEAEQQAFSKKMEEAKKAYTEKRYEDALKLYKEASELKPDEQLPKQRISEIEDILKKQKEQEEDFNKFVQEGDKAMGSELYDDAITKYESALEIKPGDPPVTAKLDEAKKKKQEKEDAEAKEKQLEEDYQNLIAEADGAFDTEDYEKSKSKYEEALKLKPNEQKPKDRIAEIDEILKKKKEEEDAAKKLEENYQNLINEGDAAVKNKNWQTAKSKFEEAHNLKKDEQYPLDQIDLINKEIEKDELEAKKNEEYNALIDEADKLFNEKKYEAAKSKYNEALGLKSDEQRPKDRIQEIDNILQEQADMAQKEEDYQKFIKEGDDLKNTKEYTAALGKYKKALEAKPGDANAQAKIDEVNKLIEDNQKAEEDQKKFDEYVAKAEEAFNAKNYSEAKANYQSALEIKDDEGVKAKIKEIDDLIAKEKDQAELDESYKKLIKEGDDAVKNKDWKSAKSKFEEAHNLKKDEQYPLDQIDLINKELEKEGLEAKKNVEYNALIDEADKLFGEKKFEEAKSKYNEALGLKSNEQKPKDRIQEIDNILQGQADQAKIEEDYQKFMKEGDDLKNIKDYTAALDRYQKALGVKPGDADAQAKIDEVNKLIGDLQKAEEEQKKFDEYVAKAEEAFNAKDYTSAKVNYQNALGIKDDEGIKAKIKEIDGLIAQEQDQAKIDEDYKKAIDEADALYKDNDYEAALEKYKKAEVIKPAEQYPKDKISELNQKIADLKDKEAKDKQFNDLVAAGDEFYNNKEYTKALEKYKEAIKAKPDPAIVQKIEELNGLIAEQDQNQEAQMKYDKKIEEADKAYDDKNWESAILLYREADLIKPSETYPDDRIAEVEEIMKNESVDEEGEMYQKIINKADKLLEDKQYDDAISYYERAKTVKTSDPYPQNQIDKINQIKADIANEEAEKDRLEKEYKDLLKQADEAYNAENWTVALEKYKEAIKRKPEDPYPQGKIDDINNKLSKLDEQTKLDEEYKGYIAQADEQFDAGNYLESIPLYEKALGVKPNEQYPKDRIAKAEELERAKSEDEVEKQYQRILDKAQEKFDASDYAGALDLYERAKNMKPSDPLPQQRIDEINQLLADKDAEKKNKEKYDKLIQQADNLYEKGDWEKARGVYEQAYNLINDQYPKDRMEECTQKMKDDTDSTISKEYQKLIDKADEYFNAKNYPKAKNLYERAVKLKPSDQYPKDQLVEIDKILNPDKYLVDSNGLIDRGKPVNMSLDEMEARLLNAEEQRQYIGTENVNEKQEEIGEYEKDRSNDQVDENFDTKNELNELDEDLELQEWSADVKRTESTLEVVEMQEGFEDNYWDWSTTNDNVVQYQNNYVNSLEIQLEESNEEDDLPREEYLADVEKIQLEIKDENSSNANSQTNSNMDIKNEVDDIQVDLEEQEWAADVKRSESTLEVIEMEEGLEENYRDWANTNDDNVQNQNDYVNDLEIEIEERNEDDDLPREEYLADVEKMQLEIKDENSSNSNSQTNTSFDVNNKVEEIQVEHVSNDPNNDIDRKNTEVHVEDFQIQMINSNNEDGWNQEDAVIDTKDQTELLIDERFAEDVGNDIPRIENVDKVEDFDEKNEMLNRNQADDQYDATQEGKDYTEDIVLEMQLENLDNDKPRQDAEIMVEDTEIELGNTITDYSTDQNNVIMNSDDKMDDMEQDREKAFEDADKDRENFEGTMEDVQLEISDYNSDLSEENEDNGHDTKDYTEGMIDTKVENDKKADEDATKNIDKTGDAIDDIVEENQKVGDENKQEREGTEDYIESLKDIDVNAVDEKMQNKLGKEFPEGVTEEIYEVVDEDGLLESFIVRRVVVINGVGNVYEMTKSKYGTVTYTRNGVSITEYQWSNDTENADLTRN